MRCVTGKETEETPENVVDEKFSGIFTNDEIHAGPLQRARADFFIPVSSIQLLPYV